MWNELSDPTVIAGIVLLLPFAMVLARLLDRLTTAIVDRFLPEPFDACCCHAEAFNLLAARARISPRPRVEDEKRYIELLGRVRDAAVELLASGPKHTAWAGDLSYALDDVVSYEQRSSFMRSTEKATPTDTAA